MLQSSGLVRDELKGPGEGGNEEHRSKRATAGPCRVSSALLSESISNMSGQAKAWRAPAR